MSARQEIKEDLRLSCEEEEVFTQLDEIEPSPKIPRDDNHRIDNHLKEEEKLRRVRARILRRIILRQPVLWGTRSRPKAIDIPKAGLKLRKLEIIGDNRDDIDHYDPLADLTAALHLEDACTTEGHPLSPLEMRDCVFHQAIYMSGAKFRHLDFKRSRMTRLKATNLSVDGNLNLAGISSSQEKEKVEPIKFSDFDEDVIGARKLEPNDFFIEEAFRECLPNEIVRRIEPDEVGNFTYGHPYLGKSPRPHQPLCWIELRNARIGVDVDVSGSTLVCPAAKLKMINSPHARYALDLRGSTVNGRLTWSPDFRNPLPEHREKQFVALGGVSIVRSRIAGSVCGSGGRLYAVEGCALAAQRAEIRGHLFLDFSWEGAREWCRFEADGFVDLTNATIGSSLFMAGARLGQDRWLRSGLIASETTIGLNCELRAIERMDDGGGLVEFESSGVRMDDATVRGSLDMNGAKLATDSFGDAMYAPGMTVNGLAKFSVLEHSRKDTEWRSFTTSGPVIMVGATFRKTVSFSGANLSLDPGHARNRSKECALQAELTHIQSTAYFLHFKRVKHPKATPVRTQIIGAISMRRARIGMNLRLSGVSIDVRMKDEDGKSDPYNRSIALDLSSAHINGILFMNAYDPRKDDVAATDAHFEVKGSILLNQATIGDEVYLEGAKVESLTDKMWGIKAYGMSAASKFGAYRPINWERGKDVPLLSVQGGIDLSHANIPKGLYMKDVKVYAGDPEDASRLPSNLMALQSTMGNINTIEIEKSTFSGQLGLAHLTVPQGIRTIELTIERGALDLWQANLGFLDLTGFNLTNPDPRIFDRSGGEKDVDALHLLQARIAGKLTITCPPASPPIKPWPIHCIERTIWRLYRRSKKANEAGRPLIAKCLHWIWRRLCECVPIRIVKRAVRKPKPYFANLRELDIGGLKDADGCGWGELRVKLEGFVCRRSPVRKRRKFDLPRLGWSGWCYTLLQNAPTPKGLVVTGVALTILVWILHHRGGTNPHIALMALSAIVCLALLTPIVGIVYWHFHMADAHVTWLNRQYVDPKAPETREFTPSAYDQLAKTLREDGHDRESRRILSAKFRIKQKVDVAPISKPFWWLYHRGFDYGLSSLAAVTALTLFLLAGCFLSIGLSRGDDALLVKGDALEHCGVIDSSLYAAENFIPFIRFGESKICKVRPDEPDSVGVARPNLIRQEFKVALGHINKHLWDPITATEVARSLEFFYIVMGWIVTSITLLTIPGILRSRADG